MSDPRRLNRSPRSGGFTLIELLVVIAIIVLLISILLPVAGRVRIQAQTAKTQALIASIGGAIERYYLDERAYPGPWTNLQAVQTGIAPTFTPSTPTGAGPTLTQSEILVGSLAGGFQPDAADPTLPPTVDLSGSTTIGKGPMTWSPAAHLRKRRALYMDLAPGTNVAQEPYTAHGCAAEALEVPGAKPTTPDSGFPEFLDAYSQARPIIYIRANVGTNASAIAVANMTDKSDFTKQYNTYEFTRYQRRASGDFFGDFIIKTNDPDRYATMDDYLSHSSVADTAKSKDKFILISSGPDRIFMTRDDIFFGGSR